MRTFWFATSSSGPSGLRREAACESAVDLEELTTFTSACETRAP